MNNIFLSNAVAFISFNYFRQVDHFSFAKTDRFKLRYLVNDTWWDKRKPGPIFFYTGNEGDIALFAQNTVRTTRRLPSVGYCQS